jgi:hypothetical protein
LSGNRGRANQALFEARILLDGWESALQQARWRPQAVGSAYLAAIRLHLLHAYGWFLLAVAGADEMPDPAQLPATVQDLPLPPPGRERPPELREFAMLERDGWLGDMLRSGVAASSAGAGMNAGLLGSDREAPGPGVVAQWHEALAGIMARMDDALSEC